MLDGLLGRSGFSSKCKSLIKPTRTRIEVLRRRAEAKQRFLKEDLAKLLANGLDVNAYGRTEDFIGGLNMLSCYNFIDQSCEYILKQLSVMQKLGQCPEECRETVASLMFAAARFSDLPELRDLRDVFQDRYGNGLECYVNQVFVEKLASKPPVVEKRIKLLHDIATEFSIQWDSKGFKQRMDSHSTLPQDQVKKLVPLIAKDDKYRVPNENNVFRKNDHRSKERIENIPHRDIPFAPREEKHAQDQSMKPRPSKETIEHSYEGPTLHNNGNENFRRKEVSNIPFVGREEKRGQQRPESDSENNGIRNSHNPSITKTSDTSPSYHNKRPEASNNDRERKERHSRMPPQVNGDEQNHEKSTRKIEVEEPMKLLKPCYNNSPLPPPYIKSNLPNLPPPYTKPNNHREPPPAGDLPLENPSNSDRRNKERERRHYQNDVAIPLPKPRSVRRKHSKSSSSHDDVGSSEDSRIVKRISSSRRKERKGLQILFDDEHYHRKDDEEEKMMDKLLLHYSKKPSVYDGKLKKKKSRSNTSKSPHHDVDVNAIDEVETIGQPVRSISLPHETEPKKVYARANSFQPDNQAPHVHPKLPDYDDLAARFAALRGR